MKDKILEYLVNEISPTIKEMEEFEDYLDELEDDSKKLRALEAYGVDNWSGYEMAMQEYYNEEE